MIFVAGTMTLDPAVMDAMRADVATLAPKVRTEPGCHHYSLLIEDAATGLVNVLEQWDDDDALNVHLAAPWVVAFLGKYGGHLQASTIRIYDIAGDRPLPGY